jgi:glycosyltransferase involved in cell wall biosynthesis
MNRILMITPYIKSQRGNSITASRLYRGLRGRGYEIDLIAMDEADWESRLNYYTGTNTYDLVHGFHALHFARIANHPHIKKLPLLLTTTGTDINLDLFGPDKEKALAVLLKAERVVVFNQSLAEQIATVEPRLQPRQAVIPQGVELDPGPVITREQLGIAPASTVFVIPSGLRPVKNLDLALDGLQEVYQEYPQIHLLIIGATLEADYTARIKDRISSLKWVSYPGEVPHREMQGILQNADIVLNTSRAEGQPQGALEAMSLGKPCILTAVPGNIGIIKHGCQGYYINTADELAACALKLIQNPHLRHIMGTAAQQLVDKNFSVQNELTGYTRLYQELLLPASDAGNKRF